MEEALKSYQLTPFTTVTLEQLQNLAELAQRPSFKLWLKLTIDDKLADLLEELHTAEEDEDILKAAKDYKLVKTLEVSARFWPAQCANIIAEEKEHARTSTDGTEPGAADTLLAGLARIGRGGESGDAAEIIEW